MKYLTILSILLAFLLVVSCQAPQEIKTQLDKQAEQIKQLETKLQEQGAAFEQLKADFQKHLEEFHKPKSAATPKTTAKPATPQPPTRVGR
jgi:peptidoglycan hydrolase CwlO-like protein